MKISVINYFIPVLFVILLGACTQEKMDIETVSNEEVTLRSTQAECDTLQSNIPAVSASNFCNKMAELLECRLNEGIDEADVMANCTATETYVTSTCLNTGDIFFNYNTVVDDLQQDVADNTNDCPGNCGFPDFITGCRTIIFTVSSPGNVSCGDDCLYSIKAQVYCCQ